jgi:hypothetical protein
MKKKLTNQPKRIKVNRMKEVDLKARLQEMEKGGYQDSRFYRELEKQIKN